MTDSTLSLEEKMHLVQQGDKRVYADLLQEISKIVTSYLYKKIGCKTDLEDVVQEILISIHKSLHTYDPSRPLTPWIFALANYRFNDYLRKIYKTNRREDSFDEIENQIKENVTESHEYTELLNKALLKLPEKQRKIVEMMKIEGYSAKEVANHFDMSVSAVKVSAHRAYKVLKDNLQEMNG